MKGYNKTFRSLSLKNAPSDSFGFLYLSDGGGGSAPTNNTPPSISGTAVVGQTLTVTAGGWSGSPTPTLSYQWYRGATPISGATSTTYTLVQADAGNTSNMKCVVTATNSAGSASADSNTVAQILDADANAYVTTVSGGLNSAEISSVNTLYIDLKSNNQFANIDILEIYAGPTNASALKSFIGGYTAIPVNSPTWTRKVGFTSTGTSYIRTGFIQTSGTKFTRLSNSFGIGVADAPTNVNATAGFNNTNYTFIGLTNTAGAVFANYSNTQGSSAFTRTIANKNFATRRVNSTDRFAYMDGVENSAAMTAQLTAFNSQELVVGGWNNNGTFNPYPANIKSTYMYVGNGNVNPQTLDTIINNFINSL